MTMIHLDNDYEPAMVHPLDRQHHAGGEGLRDRLFRLLAEEAPAVRGASRDLALALAEAEAQLGGSHRRDAVDHRLLLHNFHKFDDGVAL